MKGLKKLALASAVAAAPFAQAELTAMDDSLLEEMTGQAGITIDVDLAMTIDAIKYVDVDGDTAGSGTQGAITMKGLTIGSIDSGTGALSAATIRGITIDADGTDGLVIGLNQIGDTAGNGIDVTVDAVLINNGAANLAAVNAVNAQETAGFNVLAGGYNYVDYATGVVTTDVNNAVTAAAGAGTAADDTAAQSAGFPNFAAMVAAAAGGDTAAQSEIVTNAGSSAAYGQAAGTLADAAAASAVGDVIVSAGAGNIGGFKVENFRNYIQDSIVGQYNGVFDMALQDSAGALDGSTGAGRFVRGEIVINGTGNYAQGTSGLAISGEFGGAMDEAAWVDETQEFGIQDLGFFHGVDTDGDTISDTIEGMHFQVDINVVDHESWNAATPGTNDVAALAISNIAFEGTIMMGSIYLDSQTATVSRQSLGSVLIKDIDMTGTTVYVYGH